MITVKNVTKKYGKFKAVDNISFEVNDGEIIGLLGPNGAGKSTTMNILTGFIEPTQGEVIINGYNISKKPKKAKKCIGYMPEGVPLYKDMTVKEFITYMAELKGVKKENIKESVEQAMQDTWLQNVKKVLIKNLSKGYKQRVSMAGALVGNPEIIILDEPTVGLDPKQIIEIRNLIKKLGKNHTLIISSHILSEISQICEKVIIINKGQIVAVDSPENLEDKVNVENAINIIVEDMENKIESLKINGAKKVELIKKNDDNTKEYRIIPEKDYDIRKTIFSDLAKENITIFELKKPEITLEEAFMELIQKNEKDKEEKEKIKEEEKRQEEEQKKQEKLDKKEKKQESKKAKRDKGGKK
ncbi:MAG TPA: ABC transporter ATP-binding protein [Clostridiaceae bacterium]|nr:ABC transporter ATP-binding protein [Clostridium sp.]MEE0127464.1 ABC transporter ATP-binding protein [Clostridia bacterium]HJJ11999.1 ABC transporter ATP-binding protein [Clostridiaceae bacterium]